MENSANIMRLALIVSIIAHVLLMLFSDRDLRPTASGEVMHVDLVPANEAPPETGAPKADDSQQAKAETPVAKPDPKSEKPQSEKPQSEKPQSEKPPWEEKPLAAKPASAQPQQPPAPAKAAQPSLAMDLAKQMMQPQPQSQPSQPQLAQQPTTPGPAPGVASLPQGPTGPGSVPADMKRLADALSLPVEETGESGTARERMAKFTEGVKEFKEQVRRCFKLPTGLAAGQQLRMVIRIALAPSGALAGEPEMVAAKMSPLGPALRDSAVSAVRQCAPYKLPAAKYQDWKVLDIDFSPDQMMGS
jgi:outer membrane biosynthesis protein TonB